MPLDPILFMGGSGAIGQHTARALRDVHPDVPLLIGGRDLARAQQAADPSGLYFPYQLLDACAFLKRLEQEGGQLSALQV